MAIGIDKEYQEYKYAPHLTNIYKIELDKLKQGAMIGYDMDLLLNK